MKLRFLVAGLFCVVSLAAIPALRASADTAYMLVTKPSAGLSADTVKAVGQQEFELDNFTMTQSSPTTIKSLTAGASGGKPSSVSFSATTPNSGPAASLIAMSSLIPELRVRLDGKSATDAMTFHSCLMSTGQQTAAAVSLTFTCASVVSSTVTGPAADKDAEGGAGANVPMSRNLETYLDLNGATVHITSFAVDEQTSNKLIGAAGNGAAAGKAQSSQLVFAVPMDGSAKVLTALANQGPQHDPLKVTFVAAGAPKTKPLMVEQFNLWSVRGDTSSFSGQTASNTYTISYSAMQVLYDGSTTTTKNPPTLDPSPPAGWNRVKDVQDTNTVVPPTLTTTSTTKKP